MFFIFFYFPIDKGVKLCILYMYSKSKGSEKRVNLIISNTSGKPIYEQIVSQIKQRIMSGELAQGEMLPSIRALAKDLRISVITTKRAYDELESAGFIYTVPGKGSFVAQRDAELIREEHLKEIEEHMRKIQLLSRGINLNRRELAEIYDLLEEET